MKRLIIGFLAALVLTSAYVALAQDVNEWLGHMVFRQASPQLRFDGQLSLRSKADTATSLFTFGTGGLEKLRAAQTTAPTAPSATIKGSDFAMKGKINTGIAGSTANLVVTFNGTFGARPACVATWDGTVTYGYYVQAVASTTTTATVKIGGPATVVASWGPHDAFSMFCAEVPAF